MRPGLRFLIDECLTPELAGTTARHGYYGSVHVNHVGLARAKDWAVVNYAIERGYVVVTENAKDYKRLMKRRPMHPGLICLTTEEHGDMDAEVSQRLFRRALLKVRSVDFTERVLDVVLRSDHSIHSEMRRLAPNGVSDVGPGFLHDAPFVTADFTPHWEHRFRPSA